MKSDRIDAIYMSIAHEISSLSYCQRKQVGAIIVKDNNILSFGYNGTPSGMSNKCEFSGKTRWIVLHAESNAIVKVAKSTSSSDGATMYTTLSPCDECSKLIVQAGIKRVVFDEIYEGSTKGLNLLKMNKIQVEQIKK